MQRMQGDAGRGGVPGTIIFRKCLEAESETVYSILFGIKRDHIRHRTQDEWKIIAGDDLVYVGEFVPDAKQNKPEIISVSYFVGDRQEPWEFSGAFVVPAWRRCGIFQMMGYAGIVSHYASLSPAMPLTAIVVKTNSLPMNALLKMGFVLKYTQTIHPGQYSGTDHITKNSDGMIEIVRLEFDEKHLCNAANALLVNKHISRGGNINEFRLRFISVSPDVVREVRSDWCRNGYRGSQLGRY